MGILDDAASMISARSSHSKHSKAHRSSSHHHSHHHHPGDRKDRSRSRSPSPDHHRRHHRKDDTARSFFSLPNPSRSSFFSSFGRPSNPFSSSTSHYRRSPRPGLLPRLLRKLKRLLRDLLYYARRHPVRVLALVVMPLVTGGALTALLARFGLRLPAFVERLLGVAARTAGGAGGIGGAQMGLVGEAVRMVSGAASGAARASVERARDGGLRGSLERDYVGGGGGGGGGGGAGWGDGLRGIAKMFS